MLCASVLPQDKQPSSGCTQASQLPDSPRTSTFQPNDISLYLITRPYLIRRPRGHPASQISSFQIFPRRPILLEQRHNPSHPCPACRNTHCPTSRYAVVVTVSNPLSFNGHHDQIPHPSRFCLCPPSARSYNTKISN